MKNFMLIFRAPMQSEQEFAQRSAEEMQAEMELWNAWIGALAQEDKFIGGEPLLPEGKVLRGTAKKLTDGPYMEGKEIVGGYFLIKANDWDEALKIAQASPSLNSDDAVVEVREIMIMPS
jgi:hypothetical protein